jgi:hypothetical protein
MSLTRGARLPALVRAGDRRGPCGPGGPRWPGAPRVIVGRARASRPSSQLGFLFCFSFVFFTELHAIL